MRPFAAVLSWLSPFRSMQDVNCGTREKRIAAYRHNRRRRGELRACMRRWAFVLAATAVLTDGFDALGGAGGHAQGLPRIFVYLTAACATFLVCGACVLFVTAYVYVYLASHEG